MPNREDRELGTLQVRGQDGEQQFSREIQVVEIGSKEADDLPDLDYSIVPVQRKRKVSVSLVQEEFHMILLIVLKMS